MENSSHENVLILAQSTKQSANHSLCKLHALGNGAYGKVYKIVDRKTGKVYAFKRNLSNTSFGFSEVMREGNMMVDLNGHPLIVNIISVSYGDPFNNNLSDPLSPIKNTVENQVKLVRDDSIHFILEFGMENLDRFATSKTFLQSQRQMKQIILDLLLAVEFVNGSGIMHRDLKPDNVIIFGSENAASCTPYGSDQIPSFPEEYSSCYRAKISDFGMAKNLVANEINTPRVTTSWYLAT
jgi:serine/threonine protein kinase